MHRRTVLATVGGALAAGCTVDVDEGTTPTATGSPTPERCDPANVTRPPVVRDTDHPPQGYGTKPTDLTAQSVADYLSDFETAFATNRILDEHDGVTSLGVDTVDGYAPEAAGAGFLASSRVETDSGSVDPRTRSDRQLV